MKQRESKALETIPGIGSKLSIVLRGLGIRKVRDLKDKSPERLYGTLCRKSSRPVDRCVLYAFRCAVYYASRTKHEPRLLLWWNWVDKKKG